MGETYPPSSFSTPLESQASKSIAAAAAAFFLPTTTTMAAAAPTLDICLWRSKKPAPRRVRPIEFFQIGFLKCVFLTKKGKKIDYFFTLNN